MPYKTVKDIIDYAKELHEALGQRLDQLEQQSPSARARMLLDYLGRHEHHMQEALTHYEADASSRVLNTWFQFTPRNLQSDFLTSLNLFADSDIDTILNEAIKLDDYLVELYQEVADHSDALEVREVFENLISMEQKEKLKTVRSSLGINDF